jgi:hypothetical protein
MKVPGTVHCTLMTNPPLDASKLYGVLSHLTEYGIFRSSVDSAYQGVNVAADIESQAHFEAQARDIGERLLSRLPEASSVECRFLFHNREGEDAYPNGLRTVVNRSVTS